MKQDSVTAIKKRIAEIDKRLDCNDVTDEEYNTLENIARQLTAELQQSERAEHVAALLEIEASAWLAGFLSSFDVGTHVISNRQAECFNQVNHGQPFQYCGRSYAGFSPNYRVGFAHVVITRIK